MMKANVAASFAAYLIAVEFAMRFFSYQTGAPLPTRIIGEGIPPPDIAAAPTVDRTSKLVLPPNVRLTKHFLARMAERGVMAEQVIDILRTGRRYYDPKYGESVWWKNGVYIPVANDGALKTIVRGPVKKTWRPL